MNARLRQHNDAVKMTGHNDKAVEIDMCKALWKLLPFGLNHLASCAQTHGSTANITKQMEPMLHTNGDEIRARRGIIVTL